MDGHPGGLQRTDQGLRVLAHGPAIREVQVGEQTLVVPDGVVGGWGLDQGLVVGPGVGVGEQPDGGDGRALLRADLQRADDWNTVVIAWGGEIIM